MEEDKKKKRWETFKKIIKTKAFFRTCVVILVVIVGLVVWQGFKQRNTNVTNSYASVSSLEKVNEVTFLNVGVQKIVTSKETTKFFSQDIPFSEKKTIIILNYKAKFGIKQHVTIKQDTETNRFTVTVPKFEVTGFELSKDHPYQLYETQKGMLSHSTKDIDTGKVVIDSLSAKEQKAYLKEYTGAIKESAKSYYQQILTSIYKNAKVTVNFQNE